MKFVEMTRANGGGSVVINLYYVMRMHRCRDGHTVLTLCDQKRQWPEMLEVIESIEEIGAALALPSACVSAVVR